MRRRLLVLTFTLAFVGPASAYADWLLSPYVGMKFRGQVCPCPAVTVLLDPEDATGLRKFTFGASFGLLTDGILGLETDFAYIPGYFDRNDNPALDSSRVLTWMGNVMFAVPATISRDGLRPYLVVGGGLLRSTKSAPPSNLGDLIGPPRNEFAINIGGGALGRLTERSSARFELRKFIGSVDDEMPVRLSFWRATAGITFRY